jgi:lipopolysaccharide transport system permease protein
MTKNRMTLKLLSIPQFAKACGKQSVYLRDLVFELVSRDVKVQYKRSFIGVFWSLLNPLFQFIVFGFLFSKVFAVNVQRYSAYALIGLFIWTWFQAALLQGARSIVGNRELIRRPGFPVAVLPIVSVLVPWVQFLYALPVLFVVLLFGHAPMTVALVGLPILMFIQFLLTLGTVYLLAAINVAFRDTSLILGVLLQVMLFATPIFYQGSTIPPKYWFLYTLNPLAQLVDAYRAVLLYGKWPELLPLLILLATGMLLLALTFKLFVRMSHRFAEEL